MTSEVENDSPDETTKWEGLARPFTGMSAGLFAALSALRRNRVFHPVGEAFAATIDIWAPRDMHLPNGTHQALVRFSRGAGLPEPLPDVLGMAIKMRPTQGPEQDLLLASSGRRPGLRNLLLPSRSFLRCHYSSVLPYRIDGDQFLFGARADADLSGRNGDFGGLEAAAREAELRFEILAANLTQPWKQIGYLEVRERCDQEASRSLRFNPWHTDPELEPAGPLNTLRRSAYPASQDARPS